MEDATRTAPVVILVIGDEVLTAKVKDANGPYLLERLNRVGARVRELRIIGDDVDVIRGAVRAALDSGARVITTGGVGPTHDDRTMESVAAALEVPLELHEGLVSVLTERAGIEEPSEPLLRMCRVPRGADLVGDGLGFPAVLAGKVLVLPGVPTLVQDKFPRVEHLFRADKRPCGALFVDRVESSIAPVLNAVLEHSPQLCVGSYPRYGAAGFRVIITVEHEDESAVTEGLNRIAAGLGAEAVKHRELPFTGIRDSLEAPTDSPETPDDP